MQNERGNKIRIVVADRSQAVQRLVSMIFSELADVEMLGYAPDGMAALEIVFSLKPDVLLLSVELPRLSGNEVLREIMAQSPTVVIMMGDDLTPDKNQAKEYLYQGAMFVIPRIPLVYSQEDYELFRSTLISLIYRAGRLKTVRMLKKNAGSSLVSQDRSRSSRGGAMEGLEERETPFRGNLPDSDSSYGVVIIGSSTGGPAAVQYILQSLPASYGLPILIAQHMPRESTDDLARHLNVVCPIQVRLSRETDRLEPGVALLAPGKSNVRVQAGGRVRLEWPENELGYHPSVDVLLKSGALVYRERCLAVVLTGMGNDGADGVRLVKAAGGMVVTQDEQSSAIFGMPKAAIETGCADVVTDLDGIVACIMAFWQSPQGN